MRFFTKIKNINIWKNCLFYFSIRIQTGVEFYDEQTKKKKFDRIVEKHAIFGLVYQKMAYFSTYRASLKSSNTVTVDDIAKTRETCRRV